MKKRPDRTITNEIVTEKDAFARIIRREENNFLLFLDETGINLHTASQYGYAFLGEASYNIVPANRGRNVLLLAMVSISKIIYYKLFDGFYTSSLFLEFLNEFKDENLFTSNCIIVMDNARIHHTDEIKDFFVDNKIRKQYLSPYTPQFNPNNEVFNMIKKDIIK